MPQQVAQDQDFQPLGTPQSTAGRDPDFQPFGGGGPITIPDNAPTHPPYYGFTPRNIAENVWQGGKSLATGTYALAKDLVQNPNWFTGPTSTAQKFVYGPSDVEEAKARDLMAQGKTIPAIGHAVAGGLPLVGPWAASLGEQAGTGDIGGAAGQAIGTVGTGELDRIGVSKAIDAATASPDPARIQQHMNNGLRPARTNQRWQPSVQGSIKSGDLPAAIQDAQQLDPVTNQPIGPLKVNDQTSFWQAVSQRNAKFWREQIQPRLDYAGRNLINNGAVLQGVNGIKQGISARANPTAYTNATSEANTLYRGQPLTISEAQERVSDLNQRLDTFFKSPGSAAEIEATAPKIAAWLRERQGLNQQIDAQVQSMTGTGTAQLKKRWADMKAIEDQAFNQKIAQETKRNPGIGRILTPYMAGKIAVGTLIALQGHPEAGLAVAGLGLAESGAKGIMGKMASPEHHITKAADMLGKLPKAQDAPYVPPVPPPMRLGLPAGVPVARGVGGGIPMPPTPGSPGTGPSGTIPQAGFPLRAVTVPPGDTSGTIGLRPGLPPSTAAQPIVGNPQRVTRFLPQGEGTGPHAMPPSPMAPGAGSEATPTGGARGFPSTAQPPQGVLRQPMRVTEVPWESLPTAGGNMRRALPPSGTSFYAGAGKGGPIVVIGKDGKPLAVIPREEVQPPPKSRPKKK